MWWHDGLDVKPRLWAHGRHFWAVPHLHSRAIAALTALVGASSDGSGSLGDHGTWQRWHFVSGNTWGGPGGSGGPKNFLWDPAQEPGQGSLSMAIAVPAPTAASASVPAPRLLAAPPFHTLDPDSVPVLDAVLAPALSLYPFIVPALAPAPTSAFPFLYP